MSIITGIKREKSYRKRVNVYLDGKLAIGLVPEVALKENLRVGQEIAKSRLKALAAADLRQRCYDAAIRFLSYRPRSTAEIKQRLTRQGYESGVISKTLARLQQAGLVDDAAFARLWLENREEFRPRSRRMAAMELKRKGLDAKIIEQAVGIIDDAASAYRAALKRAPRLASLDYPVFQRRLGQYLARRGFNYSVVREVTEKVWQECRQIKK